MRDPKPILVQLIADERPGARNLGLTAYHDLAGGAAHTDNSGRGQRPQRRPDRPPVGCE
jgi:hypothetical protein